MCNLELTWIYIQIQLDLIEKTRQRMARERRRACYSCVLQRERKEYIKDML